MQVLDQKPVPALHAFADCLFDLLVESAAHLHLDQLYRRAGCVLVVEGLELVVDVY